MRPITHLVIHCTATPQQATVASIQNHWRNTLGWKSPGYHFIVEPDGSTRQLQDIALIANGVSGHNAHTIHIAYIGGVNAQNQPIDNRTPRQKEALIKVLSELKKRFSQAIIQGHRDFAGVTKACPSFDAKQEYQTI